MEQAVAPGEHNIPLRNSGLNVVNSFLTGRLQVITLSPPEVSRPRKVTWSYEPNNLKNPWLILLTALDQYLEAKLVVLLNESFLT